MVEEDPTLQIFAYVVDIQVVDLKEKSSTTVLEATLSSRLDGLVGVGAYNWTATSNPWQTEQ